MQTTRDLAEAIRNARMLAGRHLVTIYVVPTHYGYQIETRANVLPAKYVEVPYSGAAMFVAETWTNDGKVQTREAIPA